MAPRGPGLLPAVLLAAVIGILGMGRASATPPPFDPGGVMCFESLESSAECDGDTAPGAATDIRLRFCTGWNDDCTVRDIPATDSMAAGMVMFTPPDWYLPKGDTVPVGAISGRVEEELYLSFLNGPCNSRIQASGTLLNASINVNDTIAPRPEGGLNVMQPLAMDADRNGIPDGADKYPTFLAEHFQNDGNVIQPRARLFATTNIAGTWVTENIVFFEPGTTLEIAQTRITFNPALGYPAVAILQHPTTHALPLAITEFCAPTLFELLVLGKTLNNPCTPDSVAGANCPVTADVLPEFISSVGEPYPSFPCDRRSTIDDDGDGAINDGCPQYGNLSETGAQCENDTSDDGEDSTVNDGCPQVGEMSEGSRIPGECSSADEGGCTYRSNPGAAGTQTFTVGAVSERDADGDGISNGLDVCFDKPNPEWNPWGMDPVNDTDNDGLPSVCDPNPSEAGAPSPLGCGSGYIGPDEDQDCFSNRQDTCPTVPQLEDPSQPPGPANRPLQTDSDGDRIGDACDPDPNAANGDYIGYCLKFDLQVGGEAGPVVGTRTPLTFPDCAAAPICAGCGPVTFSTYVTCSLDNPVFPPAPTPSEMATITSDVTVYATVVTAVSGLSLSLPPLNPITFSDEPGLGAVDPTTFTVGTDGIAKTRYRLPTGLKEMAVATVTATTASGQTCSVSFRVRPGPVALPHTGGAPGNDTGGMLIAMAAAAVALGCAGVLSMALKRRRRA